jgi:hypothetical protein
MFRRQWRETRWGWSLIAIACALGVIAFGRTAVVRIASQVHHAARGRKTVEQCVAEYGAVVDARLGPAFGHQNVSYPPGRVTLVVLKDERTVELHAASAKGSYRLIRRYPILAASGTIGPKLREGDSQVPEGIYRIESLNPNSQFHLSLRLNYPNEFDRQQAREERRANLGGDIMIHGGAASIGCLAMGDEAAEDLFVLAARTGLSNVTVVIAPVDFRQHGFPEEARGLPAWTEQLYARIREILRAYPNVDVATMSFSKIYQHGGLEW